MRSVKSLIAAGATSLLCTAAFAADMPIAPPPAYTPPPPAEFSGWYLRGDIGMTNQQMKPIDNPGNPDTHLFTPTGMGIDSSTLFDLGAGYQFNDWIRADLIGQWRGRANLHGSHFIPLNKVFAGAAFADNYSGSKSAAVVMANVYFDLGTWGCITPYIGAGVGGSYNRVSGFRDDGLAYIDGSPFPAVTYAGDAGKWNLAWALHAGVGYKVTQNATLDVGYSYMNLGDATTGRTNSFDGVTLVNGSPFVLKDITSHDVKLGIRWNFNEAPAYAPPPPLVTKG